MSNQYTEQWLESATENFEEALQNSDFAFARAVIADLKENGYTKEAVILEERLNKAQV